MSRSSFHAYVDVFAEDDAEDNAEPNGDAAQSKELADGGWFVVTSNDAALTSVTKRADENGSRDSEAGCRLRKNSSATGNKLCGYLNKCKVGSRGAALFKRRWFVHADNSCKLLYYRTPQDIIPLGEIDIAQATFSFDVQPDISTNVFKIT